MYYINLERKWTTESKKKEHHLFWSPYKQQHRHRFHIALKSLSGGLRVWFVELVSSGLFHAVCDVTVTFDPSSKPLPCARDTESASKATLNKQPSNWRLNCVCSEGLQRKSFLFVSPFSTFRDFCRSPFKQVVENSCHGEKVCLKRH